MSHVTLGKPLHFCDAQCGHLYDNGADATGTTGLESYNQALNYHHGRDHINGGDYIVPRILRAS